MNIRHYFFALLVALTPLFAWGQDTEDSKSFPAFNDFLALFGTSLLTDPQVQNNATLLEADELKAMAGEFEVLEYVTNGVRSSLEDLKKLKVSRQEDGTWSLFRGAQETIYSDKLDPKISPREINITPSDNPTLTYQGIYEREGKLIRICYALPGNKNRPARFVAEKGSNCKLIVLRSTGRKIRSSGAELRSSGAEGDELKAMAGEFEVAKYMTNGIDTSPEDLKKLKVLRREDGTWSLTIGTQETTYADKLNPKTLPREVDITITSYEQMPTCLGIYEREGDLIRICFALPGNEVRPKTFTAEKGSNCSLVELSSTASTQKLATELSDLEKILETKEKELRELKAKAQGLRARLSSTKKKERTLIEVIDSLPYECRPKNSDDSLRIAQANEWFEKNVGANKKEKVTWKATPSSIDFKLADNGTFEARFFFRGKSGDQSLKLPDEYFITLDNSDADEFFTLSFIVTEEQAENLRKRKKEQEFEFEFQIKSIKFDDSVLNKPIVTVRYQDLRLLGID